MLAQAAKSERGRMKAIVITQPGAADVLQPAERVAPVPDRGEVLIAVAAAGVNRADLLQRQGKYPPPPGAPPDIPGLEVSGAVAVVGDGCTRYRVGDRVMALLPGGGYAEQVAVPEALCLPIPDNVSLRDAAALPEALFTVWANLFVAAQVRAGEVVLVQGGTSGIGSMAVQMLNAHGAVPVTLAGGADKAAWSRAHGAKPRQHHDGQLGARSRTTRAGAAWISFSIWWAAPICRAIWSVWRRGGGWSASPRNKARLVRWICVR